METRPKPVINLTAIPIETIELNSDNAKMIIKRFLRNIEITFFCNINGDIDTEVTFTFKKTDETELKKLAKIFEEQNMFSIFQQDENIQLDIGYISSGSVYVCFGLVDYNYDSAITGRYIKYVFNIKENNQNYYQLNEIITLIANKLRKNKEDNLDEYQPDRVEYPRQGQL